MQYATFTLSSLTNLPTLPNSHLDQTTCSVLPCPVIPQTDQRTPRTVHIVKDAHIGFGFVAGSEKPVVVRCVNEGL